ncbi:MAG: hypothetical protein EOP51_07020 [Sphingobacteriales bacterium]|nr:MAG: hypothetical protein EOP51_07020 [Sphingobacteriales bacterium]
MKLTGKIWNILSGRVARNILFWLCMLYTFLSLNINNAAHSGYNFNSRWYWYVHTVTLVLYLTVIYTNNLLLVPKYLVNKKRVEYFLLFVPMCLVAGLIQTCVIRLGISHFDANDMQQIGGASTVVEAEWTAYNIISNAIQYGIWGYLLWAVAFIMAWYMQDYSRQRRLAEAAEKKQIETELHFLKSQINPHFLFNTLNNLYGLTLRKHDDAPESILKLSSILRYLLYESNTPSVSFAAEKQIIQAYIDLELLRLKNVQGLNFHVEADSNYSIPPLLWLPVLENVFKHGTRYIADGHYADFSFTIRNNVLSITSTNSYKATANGHNKEGGIGMANLQKRLLLLYAGRYTMSESKTEDTYSINIQIELS